MFFEKHFTKQIKRHWKTAMHEKDDAVLFSLLKVVIVNGERRESWCLCMPQKQRLRVYYLWYTWSCSCAISCCTIGTCIIHLHFAIVRNSNVFIEYRDMYLKQIWKRYLGNCVYQLWRCQIHRFIKQANICDFIVLMNILVIFGTWWIQLRMQLNWTTRISLYIYPLYATLL